MKKYTAILVLGLVFFIAAGSAFAQFIPGQSAPGQPIIPGQTIVPGQPIFPGQQVVPGQPLVPGQYGLQTVPVVQAWMYGHRMPIVIQGNLVQFYGGRDLYIFRDSSGDVLVKIGRREREALWFQGISIDATDTIEIYGEVHWPRHSWGTPEIHARIIRKM